MSGRYTTEYFLEVADREHKIWTGLDGNPCDFHESMIGKPLIEAIRALKSSEMLTDDAVRQKALNLHNRFFAACEQEANANLPASQNRSDDELLKLADLADKLRKHITEMHAPAMTALAEEGFLALSFANDLSQVPEIARCAFGHVQGEAKRGAKPKIAVSELAECAGRIYQDVTGQRPTITNDIVTHEVRGDWPDFLASVFAAFHLKARVC